MWQAVNENEGNVGDNLNSESIGEEIDDVEPWYPLVTQAEWAVFEKQAEIVKPWSTYNPPQKSGACPMACVYCCLRASCCYLPRTLCVCCCKPCCKLERVWFSYPDDWFYRMLSYTHPRCPAQMKGIWWMEDNVAAEGVLSLEDAEWISEGLALKSSKYNWTVDANNTWGMVLTANFWLRGGRHQFQFSPNGKWISVEVSCGRGHFIYVIQPGDKIRRPDGTLVDVTPGEDMMRISFEEFDPESPITYQYLLRRVAYLDDSGVLVKTNNFKELEQVVKESTCCRECCHWRDSSSPDYHDLKNAQVLSFPEEPPHQQNMN